MAGGAGGVARHGFAGDQALLVVVYFGGGAASITGLKRIAAPAA